ncbi:hypothetical protein CPB97_006766 [Podila verticillata]|nr:hypothetical protein CPB97_006766 [Podila verticillata]
MFDITELDEIVFSHLDLNSLVQCAKVNKKWYKIIIPYVWHTIPKDTQNLLTFCGLVLEDYFQGQQNLEEEQPPPAKKAKRPTRVTKSVRQPQESSKNTKLPPLIRYGQLVCQVESATQLLMGFEKVLSYCELQRTNPLCPTALELVRHFLHRCPNALTVLKMTHWHFNSPSQYRLSMEILPRVTNLSIKGGHCRGKLFPLLQLKQVLAAVSINLHTLSISTPEFRAINSKLSAPSNVLQFAITARPKRLKILHSLGKDWSWLWRACDQVEDLELELVPGVEPRSLVRAIQSMPCVDTVKFDYSPLSLSFHNHKIGPLLAAGTKGWKAVHCGSLIHVDCEAFDAVLQHASTLEEVSVFGARDRNGLLLVLKLSPNLRKFEGIDCRWSNFEPFSWVYASDFIDWDPESNALRHWPCQSTLELLSIKVGNVPQRAGPLPGGKQADDRHYFETQQRVCERLGGFMNLKVLQLAPKPHHSKKQNACVHLTLETGLDRMARLKSLEELYIDNMHHHLEEVQEAEWIAENWPRLWRLVGLHEDSEAYKWFRMNRPKIQLH